jgi:uncharacterized protein YggE
MSWLKWLLASMVMWALMQAHPTFAQAPDNSNPRTVEVTGHGDANAKPDAMIVSFAVDSQAPTADQCTQIHADKVRKIIDALKSKLGADANIETSDYSLNPNVTYVQSPAAAPQQPRGLWDFKADLIVYCDSLESIGTLIDAAMAAGASRLLQTGVAEIPDNAEPAPSFFWRRKHRHAMKQVAFVVLEVETQGSSAANASADGAPRVARIQKVVTDKMGDHGIVKLREFNLAQLDPNQNRFPQPAQPPPQQVQNFVAHTTVTADTPKLDLLGPVVQTGLDSGADRLNQVQFTLHNDADARKDAIEKASAEAKTKAESVSKSMGVTLGKILRISTNAQVRPQIVYGNSFSMGDRSQLHTMSAAAVSQLVPVLPHEVGFSADVTVVYEIQ